MTNEERLNCLPVRNQANAARFVVGQREKNGINCCSFQSLPAGIAALPRQSEPCLF